MPEWRAESRPSAGITGLRSGKIDSGESTRAAYEPLSRERPAADWSAVPRSGESRPRRSRPLYESRRSFWKPGLAGITWITIGFGLCVNGLAVTVAAVRSLDAEVLLLDDLGAHRVTDWVEDTVTAIITYRCNHRKPLIATTNLPDQDMGGLTVERSATPAYRTTLTERVGERARSRLFEMCRVVNLWAVGDYRVKPSRP